LVKAGLERTSAPSPVSRSNRATATNDPFDIAPGRPLATRRAPNVVRVAPQIPSIILLTHQFALLLHQPQLQHLDLDLDPHQRPGPASAAARAASIAGRQHGSGRVGTSRWIFDFELADVGRLQSRFSADALTVAGFLNRDQQADLATVGRSTATVSVIVFRSHFYRSKWRQIVPRDDGATDQANVLA
jgi:hypothetical protein